MNSIKKFEPIFKPLHYTTALLTFEYRQFNFISKIKQISLALNHVRLYILYNNESTLPQPKKTKNAPRSNSEDKIDGNEEENLSQMDKHSILRLKKRDKADT